MSEYPEIIIDKSKNTNLDMYNKISAEEMYDFMHHTHKAEDIVGLAGGGSGANLSEEAAAAVETNKEVINELPVTVEKVETVEQTVAEIQKQLNNEDVDVDTAMAEIWDE